MFCKFVGVGGALGYWSNYYDDGWASGSNWNIDEDDNRPSNFYLRPSVVLKSPSVRFKQTQWCLYAEPGIMLNVPYQQVSIEKHKTGLIRNMTTSAPIKVNGLLLM